MKPRAQPRLSGAVFSRDRRLLRAFVLFAIIAAMLGVATASASPAHFHSKAAAGCDLCLTASLAASAQVAKVHALIAPESRRIAGLTFSASRYSLLRFHASHSRGPPSQTL